MPKHNGRRSIQLAAFLFACASIAGCGGESPSPSPTSAPERLRVAMVPFLSFAPFHIAAAEGYFTEQGLDVEFVALGRTIDAIPALITGEVDVASGLLTAGVLNAIGKGARLRIVADKGRMSSRDCTVNALMARRALVEAGELSEPAQLRGRRIDIDVSLPEAYYVDLLLQQAGLTFDDLELVNLPPAAEVDALAKGSIDLTVANEPDVTRLLRTGTAVVWRTAEEVIPDFQFSSVYYGPNLLDKRPDLGERFMAAYLKGVRKYNEGKTARNLEILMESTRLDEQLLRDACWVPIRGDGGVAVDRLLEFQSWLKANGRVDQELSGDQIVDRRFVERANAALAP